MNDLSNLFLELESLIDLAGIAVDEEALARLALGHHGVFDHVEYELIAHQETLLHQLVEMLAALGAGLHLGSQQVSARQVRVAVFSHYAFALCTLERWVKKKNKKDFCCQMQI